jgi:hypothetical protein
LFSFEGDKQKLRIISTPKQRKPTAKMKMLTKVSDTLSSAWGDVPGEERGSIDVLVVVLG